MNESKDTVGRGVLFVFILNVITFVVMTAGAPLIGQEPVGGAVVAISCMGLIQLLYLVPLYLRWKRSGMREAAKGLMIGASITVLFDATCWGLNIAVSRSF